jgi:hypothetical protein
LVVVPVVPLVGGKSQVMELSKVPYFYIGVFGVRFFFLDLDLANCSSGDVLDNELACTGYIYIYT